jgi:hypothetical protein
MFRNTLWLRNLSHGPWSRRHLISKFLPACTLRVVADNVAVRLAHFDCISFSTGTAQSSLARKAHIWKKVCSFNFGV